MKLRHVMLVCAGLAGALFSLGLQAEDARPAGTIRITETQVGLLLTGDWGHGTLTINGKTICSTWAVARSAVSEAEAGIYSVDGDLQS